MNKKFIVLIVVTIFVLVGVFLYVQFSNWNPKSADLRPNVQKKTSGCLSNPSPVWTDDITDLSMVNYIVPPGNLEDYGNYQMFKTHSYIKSDKVAPVYAPINSTLYQGVYVTEERTDQYGLFFEVSCEIFYILDHIVNPVDKIKEVFPDTPVISTETIATSSRVEVKGGELIGYSIGEQFDQWDFGVYDTSSKNWLVDSTNIPDLADRDYYAHCPYDYFPEAQRQKYYNLFDSHISQPVPTTFCSQD